MGKASKWFRSLFGFKKPDPTNQPTQTQTNTHISKEKKRWSFVKSYREKNNQSQTSTTNGAACYGYYSSEFEPQNLDNDPNKRAIAVAAATAAVAEAAVAAAKAAAEVVRLTSSERGRKDDEYDDQDSCRDAAVYGGLKSGGGGVWVEEFAAVKIQAAFRGLLARRALRALRALVKIQALVRGHIERKRTAVELKQMQAVVRAQARARAQRARLSCSLSMKPSHSHHHHQHYRIASKSNGKSTADEDKVYPSLSWSDRRTENQPWSRAGPLTRTRSIDDEKTSDKILEIDTGKHHSALKRRSLSHLSRLAFHGLQYSNSFTTSKDSTLHNIPSPSSGEVNSYGIFHSVEEEVFCTAENNSPQLYSTPSRGGNIKRTPFTPARSDCSQSSMSVYSDYPNYLSYTESSKAKMRSLSAPKQRPQNERSIFVKRFSEQRSSSTKRAASLHTNYPIKEYPGSGYLDRFGMPVGL